MIQQGARLHLSPDQATVSARGDAGLHASAAAQAGETSSEGPEPERFDRTNGPSAGELSKNDTPTAAARA